MKMSTWQFQTLQNIAKEKGWHQFISMQDYYCLIYRENEREMIPYCRDTGVGLIPYSPLARGLLARPYNVAEPTTRQKTDYFAEFMTGKTTNADVEIIGRVEKLAKEKGVSMATISLAWCLARGVTPIVELASVGRVEETVEGYKWAKQGLLTREDVAFIEEKYIAKRLIGAS